MSAWGQFLTGGTDFERCAYQAGRGVIKIAITQAAFDAITPTLPLGKRGL